MWQDSSGTAGIDMYFGQAYTQRQLERILVSMINEDIEQWPTWCRMLAWHLGMLPAAVFAEDGYAMRQGVSMDDYVTEAIMDKYVYNPGEPPFKMMLDLDARSLHERMNGRKNSGQWYSIFTARETVSEADMRDKVHNFYSPVCALTASQWYVGFRSTALAIYIVPQGRVGIETGGWVLRNCCV